GRRSTDRGGADPSGNRRTCRRKRESVSVGGGTSRVTSGLQGWAQRPIVNFRNRLFHFRRRRPDRHGRTRGFTGRRRRDPPEGGDHALVLVGGRRLLGRANLERWLGSRRQRVDGGGWPRLDAGRGGRRTDLRRLRPNVGRMWGRLHAAGAGRSG